MTVFNVEAKQLFQCTGCNTVTTDPAKHQALIQKAGGLACCPDNSYVELKPAQEPFGYFRAQPFGGEDCEEHDEGAKALYEVPPDVSALVASLQALSVTNIMIDVVPGDGSGHEVYAKSVEQVEALLNILALELDKHEHNSPIAKLRITDKGEHSLHLLALANSVKDPEAAFKALIARLGVGEFELCLKASV
jgi:hypothetical protein